MKHLIYLMTGLTLLTSSATPLHAHSDGAITIHEVEQDVAPKANLEVEKDPTGGFNVHVVTSNFVWRPEMASKEHVLGEGHAHVYLDGQKIMRIYNEWFHLNTYQFSSHSGEQILSVEFVGNDHAPYTTQGVPVGSERVISVLEDEIQPTSGKTSQKFSILVTTLIFGITFTFIWRRRNQTK